MKSFIGKTLTRRCFHNPIFVIGASRSGTSVLLQALGRHPLIMSMPGEAPFITSIGGAVCLFEFDEAKDYYQRSLRYPKAYLYDSLRSLCFEYAAGQNYGLKAILKGLMNFDTTYLKKRYWCSKTFPDYIVSRALIRLYPSVRFIYIIRNGCDVVHSMTQFSGFRHQEFEDQCRRWAQAVDKYSFLLELECAVQVRHEKLVAQPEKFFIHLFNFLEIENNGNSASFVKKNMVHPLDKPTRAGVDVKEVFRYRKSSYEDWTNEQRTTFKRICGEKMIKLGYEIPF
ncbi:MAG: sulfotransferase [Thermodesulfobacteriota bacterium]|nr:sulfotransferase [Thermodesulfobacteriota bacterium]